MDHEAHRLPAHANQHEAFPRCTIRVSRIETVRPQRPRMAPYSKEQGCELILVTYLLPLYVSLVQSIVAREAAGHPCLHMAPGACYVRYARPCCAAQSCRGRGEGTRWMITHTPTQAHLHPMRPEHAQRKVRATGPDQPAWREMLVHHHRRPDPCHTGQHVGYVEADRLLLEYRVAGATRATAWFTRQIHGHLQCASYRATLGRLPAHTPHLTCDLPKPDEPPGKCASPKPHGRVLRAWKFKPVLTAIR
jgi:hypothetical protein